nr:sialic acid-binding Ig-like lectin 14 [Misgurnus anguillicaudatus]
MLEPDLDKKNCSIIINNIKAEDEGEYTLRVEGTMSYTYSRRFKIIIQDNKPVINIPPLREGQEANLSCSVPFPCPETPPKITWWIRKKRETFTELKENITLTTSKSFIISNLTFMPTSDSHEATVKCEATYRENKTIRNKMTIEVMCEFPFSRGCSEEFEFSTTETGPPATPSESASSAEEAGQPSPSAGSDIKALRIQGYKTVNEGDTLSLNCTVDSNPPSSNPVWSFNGNTEKLKNHISAESLTITNVSKLHAGEYVCEVTYMKETLNRSININVIPYTNEVETHGTNGQDNAGQNRTGKAIDPQNVTGNITGQNDKEYFKNLWLSTVLTFLAGIATSTIFFSVMLCWWVSCNRDTPYELMDTNTESTVILEVYQEERPEKK